MLFKPLAGFAERPNHPDREAERPYVAHTQPPHRRTDVGHRVTPGEGRRVGHSEQSGGQGRVAFDDLADIPQAGHLVGQGPLDLNDQHRKRGELLPAFQERLETRSELSPALHHSILPAIGVLPCLKMTSPEADTSPPERTANLMLRQR